MRILFCDAFFSNPFVWPLYLGFKKLGHDVRWTGWGGGDNPDFQEIGLVNDFEVSRVLYNKEELTKFTYNHRYRLDIPMFDFGRSFDGHICYYDWNTVDQEIRRYLGDEWLPDLILIFEMSFSFYGDRPKRWRGIPTGYVMCDNRGIDEHWRKMNRSGAMFCFPNYEWNWEVYKTYGVNPIGLMFPCVDTDIFSPHPEIDSEFDLFYSGGNGMDLNPLPHEVVNHPKYDWASGRWEVADYRWHRAEIVDKYFGEYNYRAMFIKNLMLVREFTIAYYSTIGEPQRWAKAMHLGKISLCIQGSAQPSTCVFNGRLMASASCGRLIFTSDGIGLEKLYTPGQEVITFREHGHPFHHDFAWCAMKVLKDKIGYYLTHSDESKEIGIAARKATVERHECSIRAQQILDAVEEAGYF